jgi:hypothetical protein
MKLLKRVLLLSLSLCLALGAAAWGFFLMADSRTLVDMVAQRIETAADVHIAYRDDVRLSRGLSPTLQLAQFELVDGGASWQFQAQAMEVQLNLPGLLLGRLDIERLLVDRATLDIREPTVDARGGPGGPPDLSAIRFEPVLHQVRIAGLTLLLHGKKYQLAGSRVNELSVQLDADRRSPRLTAQVALGSRSIDVEARFPGLFTSLRQGRLPFTIESQGAIQLTLSGAADISEERTRFDIALDARVPDLRAIPTGVDSLSLPGEFTANAHLVGTLQALAADTLVADWRVDDGTHARLSGEIGNIMALEGLALQLDAAVADAEWLQPVLPEGISGIRSGRLAAQLGSEGGNIALRDVSLQATGSNALELSLNGAFDLAVQSGILEPANIDMQLQFQAPNTRAARVLLFDEVPELGAIRGSADIVAVTGDPALEKINVGTRDENGIRASIRGRIESFPLHPERPNRGYDLDVEIDADKTSLLAERLDVELPLDVPLALKHRIEGDTRALALRQVALEIGARGQRPRIDASGEILFGDWDRPDPLQSVDVTLSTAFADSRAVAALTGIALPELGPLRASARLRTRDGKHRLQAIDLNAGGPTGIELGASGVIERVSLFPQPGVAGIDLRVTASATDSAALNSVFGLDNAIPALGPVSASAKLSGSDTSITIDDLNLSGGRKGLVQFSASGRFGRLSAADHWQPHDTAVSIGAEAPASAPLAKAFGHDLPELGSVSASATLNDKDGSFGLESARITVSDPDDPIMDARGHVDNLFGKGEIRFDVDLNLDGRNLAAFADREALPELGPLRGDMHISNRDGSLGIDALKLQSSGSDLLQVNIDGSFLDFADAETLQLRGTLDASDLHLLGALLDRDWPAIGPVRMDGRIGKSGDAHTVAITLVVDDARLDADLHAGADTPRPSYTGVVKAQKFFVPGLFEAKDEGDTKQAKDEKDAEERAGPVFSREPFDFSALRGFDLDVDVDIESFHAERSRMQSAQFRVLLDNGRLSVNSATFRYPRGDLDVAFELDTRQQMSFHLAARAKDIDPRRAMDLAETGAARHISADVDIDIDIRGAGNSPHDMAASLDGGIYLTTRNGQMRRSVLDLVFVDLVGWTVGKVARTTYVDVNCGVADFAIADGVVSTRGLFMDLPDIAITGEGSIDLGNERIDYTFLPRKKSRIIVKADPVQITGSLNDPSVKVIPWKSAATTYGTLLFAPYVFVGITAADLLSGAIRGKGGESPCAEYERKRDAGEADGGRQ